MLLLDEKPVLRVSGLRTGGAIVQTAITVLLAIGREGDAAQLVQDSVGWGRDIQRDEAVSMAGSYFEVRG